MKVAVACEDIMVSGHFGHCHKFKLYDVENNSIVKTESIDNPGHKPGFLPKFLNELGVNTIIAGGMGAKAVTLFNNNSIDVVTGANGVADEIVEQYISGKLESTNSVCHEHKHSDSCGNH